MDASSIAGKVVGILAREGQGDVPEKSQAVTDRAVEMVRAYQRAAASQASGVMSARCMAVACVHLACEHEAVAAKYGNWQRVAGVANAVAYDNAVGSVRKALDLYLPLPELAVRLGVKYLMPKVNKAMGAYNDRFEECVRPAYRLPGGQPIGGSPLLHAALLQLVAARHGAVTKANMAAWQARLLTFCGVSEDRLKMMCHVVTQLCGDMVSKDPKAIPHMDEIRKHRDLVDNLDPAKVEELKEEVLLGRASGGVVIEDAHRAARKKRKHEEWKARVMATKKPSRPTAPTSAKKPASAPAPSTPATSTPATSTPRFLQQQKAPQKQPDPLAVADTTTNTATANTTTSTTTAAAANTTIDTTSSVAATTADTNSTPTSTHTKAAERPSQALDARQRMAAAAEKRMAAAAAAAVQAEAETDQGTSAPPSPTAGAPPQADPLAAQPPASVTSTPNLKQIPKRKQAKSSKSGASGPAKRQKQLGMMAFLSKPSN